MSESDPIQQLLDEYRAGTIDPSGDWRGFEAIAAAKEIVKLRAIVDEMPKTADGATVIGDLYSIQPSFDDRTVAAHVDVRATWCDWMGQWFAGSVSDFYSTPEAADAAKSKEVSR